jgi:drug/metabolite transporter (DMT)-like permease
VLRSFIKQCVKNLADSRSNAHRQLHADGLLLLVTLIWGSTFVLVKQSTVHFPVYAFLCLRFSMAAVVLLLLFGGRLRRLDRRSAIAGAGIGLFLFGGYAFQTTGLRYTSASKAGFITGLSVVIVPVLSAILLKRAPGRNPLLGALLATAGMALLSLGPNLMPTAGDAIVLGCAFCFAFHIIAVSKFAPHTDALALTTLQVAVVAVLSALACLATEGLPGRAGMGTLSAAAFTGVFATALAFAIQNSVQTFTTPTHTALIFAAEPVFAAVFGFILAAEHLSSSGWLGCLLILLGMVLAELPAPGQAAWPTRKGELQK